MQSDSPTVRIARRWRRRVAACLVLTFALCIATGTPLRAADPFEHGWALDDAASDLQVMSVKQGIKAEANRFATLSGFISESGEARIKVFLDSIDTGIDLRNVRMRFLFFETFLHPEAIITVQLDPNQLRDLATRRRMTLPLDYTLSLHGVTSNRSAEVEVTLVDTDRVVVSSVAPFPVVLKDFGLEPGRKKLQEAAGVEIVPVGIVTFNFVFNRLRSGSAQPVEDAGEPATPAAAAVESPGDLDRAACIARFQTYSETGRISFKPASEDLTEDSFAVLDGLYDVIRRCPTLQIVIAGHTGSDGTARWNRTLSRKRAEAVKDYLEDKGIAPHRMSAIGYGEARPLVPNDTPENRARNTRIELSVVE